MEWARILGNVTGLIHAAGISPTQALPATILKVDLYGTALVLEEFGNIIARGGAAVVIASQSGHRLPPEALNGRPGRRFDPPAHLGFERPLRLSSPCSLQLHRRQFAPAGPGPDRAGCLPGSKTRSRKRTSRSSRGAV